MRRYSDKTALKKIHEIMDPILEHLRGFNHTIYFSYGSISSMSKSYCYIELSGVRKTNHHIFSQRIANGWKWHDVYEYILECKDNIYPELSEYLHVIDG